MSVKADITRLPALRRRLFLASIAAALHRPVDELWPNMASEDVAA